MGKKKELSPEEQETIRTKDFFDMILPGTVKFFTDHYIVGDSYRCVWAVREYPPSTEEQAILSQLADRNGVTLHIYHRLVEPMEQRKIIQNATRRNKMKSGGNDVNDTIEAEGNLQDVVNMLANLRKNREPLLHCSVFMELKAKSMDILKNNPHITEVHPCLDHDKAGIEGDYRIAEVVRELGEYRIKPELPLYKDWNEGLKAINGIEPIAAVEHPGLVEMKKLCAEIVEGTDGVKIKNLLEHFETRFKNLTSISLTDDERLSEQSYELSWIAFLFGRNKLESMEKHYTNEEYAKMIYQLYPPHKDNVGYKSRISDMRENLSEVLQVYKKDEILTESEQMNLVKRVMQLSVDCLRFYMYAENKIQEQREGESACQISQISS